MRLDYYIENLKAVDVFNLKPLKAYEKVLGLLREYIDDTDDFCPSLLYNDCESINIPDRIKSILEEDGWIAVWEFLRHLPEESIHDDHFIGEADYLRTITTDDVVMLRNSILHYLQKKQLPPEQKLIQDLRDLGEITPYNRQFYEMQTLVQEYARDTGDLGIKEYLKQYAGHLEVRKVLQGIIKDIPNAREATIYAKEFLDSLDLTAEVFHDDDNLEPATTEGLNDLREKIISELIAKENKDEA